MCLICINKTLVEKKSQNISDLTSTILTAAKGGSFLDYIAIESPDDHLWQTNCGGNINIINKRVLLLKNGIISGYFLNAKQTGEVDVENVIGQAEKDEFVTVEKEFIRVPCEDVTFPKLDVKSGYIHFIESIDVTGPDNYYGTTFHRSSEQFVIIIERKDYANVYWTMVELYNAFLTVRMFLRDPKQTCVFLLDVHPKGKLDEIWEMVFGNVVKVKDIKNHEWNFKNLVFGIDRYSGPITTELESLPFISEFQQTIYHANGIITPTKKPCSLGKQYLNITLILRHDYVAHARNPTGKIKRKLANEGEIISHIKSAIPSTKLTAVQLEDLSMKNQVELIYHTDIMIGVHGAGLGHVTLMRPDTGLIELFPTSYFLFRNRHFEDLAGWVGVHYYSWYNRDIFFSDLELMYVSPKTIEQLIKEMAARICSSGSRS